MVNLEVLIELEEQHMMEWVSGAAPDDSVMLLYAVNKEAYLVSNDKFAQYKFEFNKSGSPHKHYRYHYFSFLQKFLLSYHFARDPRSGEPFLILAPPQDV